MVMGINYKVALQNLLRKIDLNINLGLELFHFLNHLRLYSNFFCNIFKYKAVWYTEAVEKLF